MTRCIRTGIVVLLTAAPAFACRDAATDGRRADDSAATASAGRDLRAPAIGALAPEFTAMQLDGSPVTLASLAGKVVVLNVWATWCLPCLEEIPQLEAMHQQYAARGVHTVGVSIDAPGMGADVADFARTRGMTYDVWLDPEHQFSLKFATNGVPETLVIDRSGRIRFHMTGALRQSDTSLVAAVRRALDS